MPHRLTQAKQGVHVDIERTDPLRRRLRSYLLSAREEEIVSLLVQGFTNREIAERCYISEQTVKDHLKNVYRKMGVHQRGAAVAMLLGTRVEPQRAEEASTATQSRKRPGRAGISRSLAAGTG